MRKILFYILYLELINISFSFFPIWNFYDSAIEIKNSQNVTDKNSNNINIKIKKDISLIAYTDYYNFLYIDDENFGQFNFEDVESGYKKGQQEIFICPKGKFHMILLRWYQNYDTIYPFFPEEDEDWELKCFWELDQNRVYVGYLNSEINLFEYNITKGGFITDKSIKKGIYDIKWNTNQILDSKGKKQVFGLIKDINNQLLLNNIEFTIKYSDQFKISSKEERTVSELKTYSKAFFTDNDESDNFYWMTYDSNASSFTSGYYNQDSRITTNNLDTINLITNINKSPFEFYDAITIKSIKFIPYTKFAYYEIYNEDKKVTYHGIIDVVLNQIIFNTDEELLKFVPYTKNSMLALPKKQINYAYVSYKICTITDDNDEDCLDECTGGEKVIYNLDKPNYCDIGCANGLFTFIPYGYCINSCDEKLYTVDNDKKKCGLCKDIFPEKPFKMVNYTGCLEKQPDDSYYINENLKLLSCNDGVIFKEGRCGEFKCYDNCKKCYGESYNPNEQKCLTCKENFVLQGENCIDECLDGYFENKSQICEECDNSCEACIQKPNKCLKCKNGFYLEKYTCNQCSSFCETCSKGENDDSHNCLSCKQDSEHKYFFEGNCYINCPNLTKANNNNICIKDENNDNDNNNNKEKEDNNKDDDKKKDKIFLSSFVVVFYLIIIIIMICFIKKNCCQQNNNNDKVVNQIYKELI